MPVATRTVNVNGLVLLLGTAGLRTASANATDVVWAHLQTAVDELPHAGFDAAAVVAHVGTYPLDPFAWVRDETR